ncbi:MAG: hypothetical protein OEW45_09160 [Deltaproteobacteria bacterium]|nr:hypothetical protein [Deltaproteobacteria bacterium]
MDFVGSSFKERVVEFLLALSGNLFYHLFLRPKDFFSSRKKNRQRHRSPIKEAT